jgi:hypothetical protein
VVDFERDHAPGTPCPGKPIGGTRRWRGYEPIRDIKSNWMLSRTKNFGDYETVKNMIALLNIGAYHSADVRSFGSLLALPSRQSQCNSWTAVTSTLAAPRLLPPAADVPLRRLWAAMCHFRTHAPQQNGRGGGAVLFNYLIGAHLYRQRHLEAKRLRGLEVEHELELRRLFDRQVRGLGAL